MSKRSRLLKELRHDPVKGHSMFHNPDILSSPKRKASSQNTTQSSHCDMPARKRRAVMAVPATLLDQCTICMEEQLFSQGFSLLTSVLHAGLDTNAPACIPPPPHLALASTLAVHPSMTTRTDDQDKHAAANAALRYLRDVVAVVGVEHAGIREALQYGTPPALRSDRSSRAKTRRSNAGQASDEEVESGNLRSKYIEGQSVAENAQDFWAVVGWAFNCSVRHKARWERWREWLELMLDVLEEDLERYSARGHKSPELAHSLIAQYMSIVGAGRNNKRRVMRAVLADGDVRSMAEFGEIWKNETRPVKKEELLGSKRRKLDLDNDDYGDYLDNESEEDEQIKSRMSRSRTAPKSRRSRTPADFSAAKDEDDDDIALETASEGDAIAEYGGMDSIRLRQRFLSLFTNFSLVAPNLFVDTEELFAIYTEFIRPLPLSIFQQFALPLRRYLSPNLQASLNEMLFRPLLGTTSAAGLIDQAEFESSFATSAATSTSATDNAKVSLLTESMLRALWTTGTLTPNLSQLKVLVEQGVKLRHDKVAGNGRRKTGKTADAEDEARLVLEHSGQRMMVLLNVLAQ